MGANVTLIKATNQNTWKTAYFLSQATHYIGLAVPELTGAEEQVLGAMLSVEVQSLLLQCVRILNESVVAANGVAQTVARGWLEELHTLPHPNITNDSVPAFESITKEEDIDYYRLFTSLNYKLACKDTVIPLWSDLHINNVPYSEYVWRNVFKTSHSFYHTARKVAWATAHAQKALELVQQEGATETAIYKSASQLWTAMATANSTAFANMSAARNILPAVTTTPTTTLTTLTTMVIPWTPTTSPWPIRRCDPGHANGCVLGYLHTNNCQCYIDECNEYCSPRLCRHERCFGWCTFCLNNCYTRPPGACLHSAQHIR